MRKPPTLDGLLNAVRWQQMRFDSSDISPSKVLYYFAVHVVNGAIELGHPLDRSLEVMLETPADDLGEKMMMEVDRQLRSTATNNLVRKALAAVRHNIKYACRPDMHPWVKHSLVVLRAVSYLCTDKGEWVDINGLLELAMNEVVDDLMWHLEDEGEYN